MRKKIELTAEQHKKLSETDSFTQEGKTVKFKVVEDKLCLFGRKQEFFSKILQDCNVYYKLRYSIGTSPDMTWEQCNSKADLTLKEVFKKTNRNFIFFE